MKTNRHFTPLGSVVKSLVLPALMILVVSCGPRTTNSENMFNPVEGKVKLMNLDPGHFHASLVQKTMYKEVDPEVHVYAPDGPEVNSYLNRIKDYNSRPENPTTWEEKVYKGENFLEKMLSEKPGNVMVVSGNNAKKTEYILKTAEERITISSNRAPAFRR